MAGSPRARSCSALSACPAGPFIARESRIADPLVPLRIFRSRNVSGANSTQILAVAGMFGVFFLGALYMERVLHYDPLEIGLAFLPVNVVMGMLSLKCSEPLIMRFGARRMLIPGLFLIAAALLLFTRAPVDGNYLRDVFPVMTLLGFGAGLAFPSLMTLTMSGATMEDAGLASGLAVTAPQVGGAIGLAVLATLSTTRTDKLLADGTARLEALNSGYHLAYWIAAGLVLASIAVAATVLKPEEQAKAEIAGDGDGAGEPALSHAA